MFFLCCGPFLLVPRVIGFFAVGPGCAKFFFFFAPLGAATFRRGQSKKKQPGCFLFCSGPVPARGFSFPCLSPGPEPKKKKNTLGGVVFFAAAPRGRSLTHCGPGWRCLPLAGVAFFFCCGPARTGVVFFFLLLPRPDAHSLTAGWGWCFFLLRPRRVFLDNNKKCLGYYIPF